MFKLKISIYMNSGNIIHIRAKEFLYTSLSNISDKKIQWEKINCNNMSIDIRQVAAIIVKKWYQQWG